MTPGVVFAAIYFVYEERPGSHAIDLEAIVTVDGDLGFMRRLGGPGVPLEQTFAHF